MSTLYRAEGRYEDSERPTWRLEAQDDVNVALLRRALDWVTENPETHNQGTWFSWQNDDAYTADTERLVHVARRIAELGPDAEAVPAIPDTACGTAGCLFGWAVVLDGGHTRVRLTDRSGNGFYNDPQYAVIELLDYSADWYSGGRGLLHLSTDNADALSHAENSLGDLWRIASIITGGEIVVPEAFTDYDGLAEAQGATPVGDDRCDCGCEG
jgi:hypothetical protein